LRLAILHDRDDAEVTIHALLHGVSEDILHVIPGHAEFISQIDASAVAEIFQSSVVRDSVRQVKSKEWEDTQKIKIDNLIKQAKREAIVRKGAETVNSRAMAEYQQSVAESNAALEKVNNLIKEQNELARIANDAYNRAAEFSHEAKIHERRAEQAMFASSAATNAMNGAGRMQSTISFGVNASRQSGVTMIANHTISQGGLVVASGSAGYNSVAAYQQRVDNVAAKAQLRNLQNAEQLSLTLRGPLAQLQQVVASNPNLQGYQLPKLDLSNPYTNICKRIRAKLNRVSEWAREVRSKLKLKDIWNIFRVKLLGHINYYAISHNTVHVHKFIQHATRIKLF